jgi:hypothetical protein
MGGAGGEAGMKDYVARLNMPDKVLGGNLLRVYREVCG